MKMPFCRGINRALLLFALLFYSVGLYSQQLTIRGVVTEDPGGEPLPGVSVIIKGTSSGTATDANGNYSIRASAGQVLVFSMVGLAEKQVTVGTETIINVTLGADTRKLEEVVIIGYGTQKRAEVTGAVATFKAENLDERPVARVDQALVGQLAGVTVKQTTGTPGKAMSVQVRGTGSISAGNEPLYVVDGFPLASATPNGSGNFASGNPLDNINPNDIESIQVLKDAASAAIYGSRAANGVVIITTKRGKSGKATINFNTYVGYSERSRKLDMLNGPEWIDRAAEIINNTYYNTYKSVGASMNDDPDTRRQILANPPAGVAKITVGPDQYNSTYMVDPRWSMPDYGGLKFIDWQDEAFRKGFTQNHQISASGANENVNYYISGNYATNDGMIRGMNYKAYSGRANVEITANKKLKFGLNIAPTYSITNDPGVEGKDNILHQLVSMTPVQVDDPENVNVFNYSQYQWSTSPNSPLAKLNYIIGNTRRFRTLSTVFGEYEILNGLKFRTTLNLDNTDNNAKGFVPYTIAGSLTNRTRNPNQQTSGNFTGYRKQTFVNENTLSYNKILKEIHDLSVLAGYSYNSDKIDNVRVASTGGFSNSTVTTLNNAVDITGFTGENKNVLESYFGRVQYSLKNRYLFSTSHRFDASSRFSKNHKWGYFPSVSAGWRIIEEPFMKKIPNVSDLKIRASWGRAGNYNIGDYSGSSILASANYSFNGASVPGQTPSAIVSDQLTWETSETFDVGLDAGILANRITASFDIYSKLNKDLLLNVAVPGITGFQAYLNNAGKVKNKGWELEVTSRNLTGAFQWTTSINFSHNTNKVQSLPNGQNQILIPSAFDISHSILKVGEPMYSIYVVKQIGILSQEDINNGAALFPGETVGDPKYFDANNDNVIDANDRVIVGHPTPDYTWGISNGFKFRGFDLNVLIQGQNGGSIYSLLGRALGRTGQGASDNALGFYRDRWRSESDPGAGRVSKAYSTFGRIKNTDWLYSSNYVRVRNITLGYNLGQVLKTKQVQNARVYLTAENFFGWDKYKGGFNPEAVNTDVSGSSLYPEAGDYGGLPLPKSLILGLNFNF